MVPAPATGFNTSARQPRRRRRVPAGRTPQPVLCCCRRPRGLVRFSFRPRCLARRVYRLRAPLAQLGAANGRVRLGRQRVQTAIGVAPPGRANWAGRVPNNVLATARKPIAVLSNNRLGGSGTDWLISGCAYGKLAASTSTVISSGGISPAFGGSVISGNGKPVAPETKTPSPTGTVEAGNGIGA
jgi:hypothetical protein